MRLLRTSATLHVGGSSTLGGNDLSKFKKKPYDKFVPGKILPFNQ